MFANLKNKLIEEVKASPSKFQQLAQQAQAAVSSSSTTPSSGSGSDSAATSTTTTNENFFSITEEDTPQNTPLRLPFTGFRNRGAATPQTALNNGSTGAIPRTRKLSNSSMASDVSFRLPTYDAAPATYHLQSDLESEYGSEFGDDVTSPAKLEVISKEKLFEAYKRSLERYNKYRCRYTDLVKQYKELERDSSKARAVLIETQDKALRRINELREQCVLEQGAKAHLEQALRLEMDDMKCKIQAYETKLKVLGENPDNIKIQDDSTTAAETLIDLSAADDDDATKTINGNKDTNETGVADTTTLLQTKIQTLEHELKERDEKIKEMNANLSEAQNNIEQLKKQEEENSLLLAQTKQAIHTELENKEKEVKKLQTELNEQIATSKKEEATSAKELKDLREKLQQSAIAKQEIDAKLIATEHLYNELKEQQNSKEKNKNEAAERLRESEQQLQQMRQQNAQLNEMLQRYQQNEISLADIDNELNRTKNDNDNLRAQLEESAQNANAVVSELKTLKEAHEKLVTDHENLIQELTQLKTENTQSESLNALKAELALAKQTHDKELETLREQLNGKEKELKSSVNKVAKQKKQQETQQNKIKEQNLELEKLRDELNQHAAHLEKLQSAATEREQQTESEKSELKTQIASILGEISNMEEQMRIVQQSHAELEEEKRQLELHIENLQREGERLESSKLADLEKKLQSIEVENTQLSDRNCLLTENVNSLEKQFAEKERLQTSESATIESELRAKLETAEDALQRLNEKMAQVLDENSRLHNAHELMEHDQRTLQDKCDAMEKARLLAEDMLRDLSSEMESLRNNNETQQEQVNAKSAELRQQSEVLESLTNDLQQASENIEQLQLQLAQQIERNGELMELDANKMETLKEKEIENEMLKAQLNDYESSMLEFERLREEHAMSIAQREQLEVELVEKTNEIMQKIERIQELETNENVGESDQLRSDNEQQHHLLAEKQNEIEKLREQMAKNARERTEEHESLKQELTELIELEHRAVEQLEEIKAEQKRKIDELELRLQAAQVDIERLHENNVGYEVEIEQLQAKHTNEVQELNATLIRLQDEHTKLQLHIETTQEQAQKIKDYEEMKVENEYLNKHCKQLEAELEAQKSKTAEECAAIVELKEKLKSLQCELYVLKEQVEAHQAEVEVKASELIKLQTHEEQLKVDLENERVELKRQIEHAAFVTEQNDGVQKDLLHAQQQLQDATQALTAIKLEMERKENEYTSKCEEIEKLSKQNVEIKNELAALQITVDETSQQQQVIEVTTTTAVKPSNANDDNLRELNAKLQLELEQLKEHSTAEITHLQHEIEDMKNNAKHDNERIIELKTIDLGEQQTAQTLDQHAILTEKIELESKLKEIINEVQEVSNRNLFLEQQCENYLILEQSNERLKSQNAKLSRQLDETLVSVQHNDGLNANTEFEYLKNIMFQYFTGSSNGNNETLVKVISAVLKFSPQQTQVALEKEHQRRSLLNKIL